MGSSSNKVAFVCFWWGRWPESDVRWGEEYVRRLHRSLESHTSSRDWDFRVYVDGSKYQDKAVLSDFPVYPISRWFEALKWNLKKFFMFSAAAHLDRYEWVVTMDLDVVITGNVDFLLQHRSPGGLTTCRAAYQTSKPGGSIIGFAPGEKWQENLLMFLIGQKKLVEEETGGSERKFYRKFCDNELMGGISYWQDAYPGRILSFKVDGPPKNGASVVRFHGEPRPHEVVDKLGWVKDYWR